MTRQTLTRRLLLTPFEDRTNPAPAVALSDNQLFTFDTDSPAASAGVAVTGLAAGENLVGIDVRPQNGQLYGLASDGAGGVRLYAISRSSAVATPLTAASQKFDDGAGNAVNITGTKFGIDFNPTVDRLRVVTDTGFNFRMNPNTGLLIDGNGTAAGVNPDGTLSGGATAGSGTAYTNSSPNVAVTTQYTLDAASGKLFIQNPPNAGTLTEGLAVTVNGSQLAFTAANGFDIPSSVAVTTANAKVETGTAVALLTVDGKTAVYAIDLATGKAVGRGAFAPATSGTVQGLALLPTAATTPMIALVNGSLYRFNSATPTTGTTVAVTGVTSSGVSSRVLVGIDYRPSTGQLFGVGVSDTANAGNVYLIDPQDGKATLIAPPGTDFEGFFFEDATGARVDLPAATVGYGVDFNPTVDRIRVVTGSGLNFRLNPILGTSVDGDLGGAAGSVDKTNTDKSLNGGGGAGTGTAYTNSFVQAGTAVTTQYTLDAATDKLFIQNPPNAGTLVSGVGITVDGKAVDFSAVNGFEIPTSVVVTEANKAATGVGFAGLTVGGVSQLYSIDLTTGAATAVGKFGDGTGAVSGLTAAAIGAAGVTGPLLVGGPGFSVGQGSGNPAPVRVYTSGQAVQIELNQVGGPVEGAPSGSRVATADFNGDGVPDVVIAGGPGKGTVGTPRVSVLNGVTGAELFGVTPFEASFVGGVYVAAGDVTGDGKADLVISPDEGGGPRVDIYTGAGFAKIASFFGIADPNFRGGARPAIGDFNGDGTGDLVVAAGFGGGPRVAVFNGTTLTGTPTRLFNDFFVFEETLRNGAFVAAGDLDGDGKADLIAGGGPGGGPRVFAVSGAALVSSGGGTITPLANFFAGDQASRGGVRVAARNIDGDSKADIVVGSGTGDGGRVRGYAGSGLTPTGTPAELFNLDVFPSSTNGVYVG